jgi:TfoX/Sxy family transcriptional regulator of competence genes
MAYEIELAERLREHLIGIGDVIEKKMFGGLAFLLGGHMCVVAMGAGGLMVRVDPATAGQLIDTSPAEPMVMRNREMRGWLRIQTADVPTDEDLGMWVARAVDYTLSLPPKQPKLPKR